MSIEPYFPNAQQKIPFVLAGREGHVAVYYGPDDDPVKAGFDHIPGIHFPLDLCLGYPVMQVEIESYAGFGYRTLCGWIQIVTREERSVTADGEPTDVRRSCSIDVIPSMRGLGMPFATFGELPLFFDAPCRNLGDSTELTWTADTFLTTVPVRSSQKEKISRLLGFRWGYQEYDNPTERPVTLLPLVVTDAQAWNDHLPFLRQEFSDWRFEEA
jgi:hypothetical protein